MPTPFAGNDPSEWVDHFQLPGVLKENMRELDIRTVEDIAFAFTEGNDLYVRLMRGLTVEEVEAVWNSIVYTEKLMELWNLAREHFIRRLEEGRQKLRHRIQSDLKVDLVFLLDCTRSMDTYVGRVKDGLRSFVTRLRELHAGVSFFVGVVAYRDYCDGDHRLEFLQLTDNIESVLAFISSLRFSGGGDIPEDVLGGMHAVCHGIQWRDGTRVLYHIGDAPCHGTRFHNLEHDGYPNGDTVNHVTAEDVLTRIMELSVKYIFFKVHKRTDKMIRIFNEILATTFPEPVNPIEVVPFRNLSLIDAVWAITSTIVTQSTLALQRTKRG